MPHQLMITPMEAGHAQDDLSEGHAALANGAWAEAAACFRAALDRKESAEAWEGLSWASWWQNDSATLFRARERSYRLARAESDHYRAARMAAWLASDYADFRGELAVARGWRERARRLLESLSVSAEHGWLEIIEGDTVLLTEDDTVTAIACAQRAAAVGATLGDSDLLALGLAMEGIGRVTQGEVEPGLKLLDEAATRVIAGELRELWASTWVYCYLIYACERVRDYGRAAEWCHRMRAYAEEINLRFARGVCRAHYAGILIWRGHWSEAERELTCAVEDLEASRPPFAAEATVRLAELRRRQGRLDEAASLFEQVGWHPLALIGKAEVALDLEQIDDAEELLERLLRNTPETSRTQRAECLALLARTQALKGDFVRASATWAELAEIAALVPALPIRAAAAYSAGIIAAASEQHEDARRRLEDAVDLFVRADAPYEASRARLDVARVLRRLGRENRARAEAAQAGEVLNQLGATHEATSAEEFAGKVDGKADAPLTPRQLEILQLVSNGLGDREIAARLVLSQHTVHRHVANMLTRLGLSSRAAMVAWAAKHRLLD